MRTSKGESLDKANDHKATILFLDLDGVLSLQGMRSGRFDLDPNAVNSLQDFLKVTSSYKNINTVISSDWRRLGFSFCAALLSNAGLELDFHPNWKTPSLPGKGRKKEIITWIEKQMGKSVTCWDSIWESGNIVILDDQPLFADNPCFFKTNPRYGITFEISHAMVEFLGDNNV